MHPSETLKTAQRHLDEGQVEKSMALVQEVLVHDPTHLKACILEGIVHREKGELADALSAFDRAAVAHPDHPLPFINRSKILKKLGDPEGAIENLKKAYSLHPTSSQLLDRLIDLLLEEGAHQDALGFLDAKYRKNPQDPSAAFNLARCLLALGEFEAATPLFEAVLSAAPSDPNVLTEYSEFLNKQGKTADAIEFLEQNAPLVDQQNIWIQLSWFYEKVGQLDNAEQVLEKLLSRDGDNISLLARRARITENSGKPDTAQKQLVRILGICEGRPELADERRWAQVWLGKVRDVFEDGSLESNIPNWREISNFLETPSVPSGFSSDAASTKPSAETPLILLAACDSNYFNRHARAFITSAHQNAPNCHVHIHIVQNNSDEIAVESFASDKLSISKEVNSSGSRTVYACKRFLILPDILALYRTPVLILDIDTYINKDCSVLLTRDELPDALVYAHKYSHVFQQLVAAGCTFVNNSDGGRAFASFVSNYCRYYLELDAGAWFLDQKALGTVFALAAAEQTDFLVDTLPSGYLDTEYFDADSIIWAAKGTTKLPFKKTA